MKKYLGYFVVALLGGLIAVGTFAMFQNNRSEVVGIPQKNMPVQFTSGAGPAFADFTAAANISVHSVVHIKTEYEKRTAYYDQFFDLRDFFGGSPFQDRGPVEGAGSGVIISPDGYIVTNNHVVQDASKIEVVLNDKRSYEAQVIGTDPSTDLAVVKIDEKNLPYLLFGNSDDVKIGEWVLAVGNPFNLTSTVTAGIVSAKARNINILGQGTENAIESFIQTDAAVNRGNSGGALVNTSGELIGINAAIASGTGFYAGYSFAIPVNIVKKVANDLIDYGTIQRAFLGVNIREIDSKFADQQGIKDLRGVYVADVVTEGSAEEAGIKSGDVIVAIDKIDVNSTSELLEIVGRHRPGDKVTVTVNRNGRSSDFSVTLRNRDGNTSLVKKEDKDILTLLGATFEQPNAETLGKLGIKYGVQVTELNQGLLAEAGIRKGFVITEIDKKQIRTLNDIDSALKSKRGGVLIEGVYPNGTRAYYGFGI